MKYESIADIYSAMQKAREFFTATLAKVSPEEAVALPEGEKWSIQQIAEHVAIVDYNASRICAKLLDAARTAGSTSDGSFTLSPSFSEKTAGAADVKLEAPERVHPTGEVAIDESLRHLSDNREFFASLRPDLERYDLSGAKFPHPIFGDMTAAEWMVVAGGHEARHARQIGRILEKIRQ